MCFKFEPPMATIRISSPFLRNETIEKVKVDLKVDLHWLRKVSILMLDGDPIAPKRNHTTPCDLITLTSSLWKPILARWIQSTQFSTGTSLCNYRGLINVWYGIKRSMAIFLKFLAQKYGRLHRDSCKKLPLRHQLI